MVESHREQRRIRCSGCQQHISLRYDYSDKKPLTAVGIDCPRETCRKFNRVYIPASATGIEVGLEIGVGLEVGGEASPEPPSETAPAEAVAPLEAGAEPALASEPNANREIEPEPDAEPAPEARPDTHTDAEPATDPTARPEGEGRRRRNSYWRPPRF